MFYDLSSLLIKLFTMACVAVIYDLVFVSFNSSHGSRKKDFIAKLPSSLVFGFALTVGIEVRDQMPSAGHPFLAAVGVTATISLIGELGLWFFFRKARPS